LIGELGRIGSNLRASEMHDPRFDPPFSTVQTGVISGGKVLNIVPADCRFDFEVRALPAQDAREVSEQLQRYAQQEVLPRMLAVNADSAIRFSELSAYPGLATDSQSEAARLIAQFCGSSEFTTVAFGTEGGLYDAIGIATVVCGPGSMDQGHKPDEFVSIEQLAACDAMLDRIAQSLHS
jgi:acetylornithine deacetylase